MGEIPGGVKEQEPELRLWMKPGFPEWRYSSRPIWCCLGDFRSKNIKIEAGRI